MKTNIGDPHRNFVDFAHVPVVKQLTSMTVCIDPPHSVGARSSGPEGILDIMHVTAQGIVAGANMVLVDFHPEPSRALVDGPQALLLKELPYFLEDVQIAREAYEKRIALNRRLSPLNHSAYRKMGMMDAVAHGVENSFQTSGGTNSKLANSRSYCCRDKASRRRLAAVKATLRTDSQLIHFQSSLIARKSLARLIFDFRLLSNVVAL